MSNPPRTNNHSPHSPLTPLTTHSSPSPLTLPRRLPMLSGLGNLSGLLRQAQQMGSRMQELQAALHKARATGTAGGGLVEVEVNGLGRHPPRDDRSGPDRQARSGVDGGFDSRGGQPGQGQGPGTPCGGRQGDDGGLEFARPGGCAQFVHRQPVPQPTASCRRSRGGLNGDAGETARPAER